MRYWSIGMAPTKVKTNKNCFQMQFSRHGDQFKILYFSAILNEGQVTQNMFLQQLHAQLNYKAIYNKLGNLIYN